MGLIPNLIIFAIFGPTKRVASFDKDPANAGPK
jgi:hypothetical protein